ncbi:MAG: hypothetical protein ACTS8Z_01795, partial [Candidatus Limnocylindrales bacterium]
VLVMAGSHVAVARYDMIALDALTGGCIFIGEDATAQCDRAEETPGPSATVDPSADPTASATPDPSPIGTPVPTVSIPPW